MKRSFVIALFALTVVASAHAQVAGTTTLVVATLDVVASGWSAKRQVLGKPVYNEDGVDLTLIRWMLSLTPTERLEVLQSSIDLIQSARPLPVEDGSA